MAKPNWANELYMYELDEGQHLLHAAIWFWMANGCLKRNEYSSCMSKMLKAASSLGAMHGVNQLRRQNALKSNKENIEIKNQALEYWNKHIDKKLSNDKAAIILAKQVPLSIRVLSRYVSEAKKNAIMASDIRTELIATYTSEMSLLVWE